MRTFHSIIRKLIAMPVVITVYFVFSMTTGIYISCPFRCITGLKCPGCGLTHMILYLLRGRMFSAFVCNPVLMLLVAYTSSIRLLNRMYLCKRFIHINKYIDWILIWHYDHQYISCIILVCWGIIRNIFGI